MKGEMAEVIPISRNAGLRGAIDQFNAFVDSLSSDRQRTIMETFLRSQFHYGKFSSESLTVLEIAFLTRWEGQHEYAVSTVRAVMGLIRESMRAADFADLIWISEGYRWNQQGSPSEFRLSFGIEPPVNQAIVLTRQARLALRRSSKVVAEVLDSPDVAEREALLQARVVALDAREELLVAKEQALLAWNQGLKEREAKVATQEDSLKAREASLTNREAAIAAHSPSNAPEQVQSEIKPMPASPAGPPPPKAFSLESPTAAKALADLKQQLIMPDNPEAFRREAERISTRSSLLMKHLLDATCKGLFFPLKDRSPSAAQYLRDSIAGTKFAIENRADGSFLALRDETDEKRMLAITLTTIEAATRGQFNGDRAPAFFRILIARSQEDPKVLRRFANLCRYPLILKPALQALSSRYSELQTFLEAMEAFA